MADKSSASDHGDHDDMSTHGDGDRVESPPPPPPPPPPRPSRRDSTMLRRPLDYYEDDEFYYDRRRSRYNSLLSIFCFGFFSLSSLQWILMVSLFVILHYSRVPARSAHSFTW